MGKSCSSTFAYGGGRLVLQPRLTSAGKPAEPKAPTGFSAFVEENMTEFRKDNPGTPHKAISENNVHEVLRKVWNSIKKSAKVAEAKVLVEVAKTTAAPAKAKVAEDEEESGMDSEMDTPRLTSAGKPAEPKAPTGFSAIMGKMAELYKAKKTASAVPENPS
eukprot:m51a1_g2729 hypothetical protein (162) ;mRNA; f:877104-881844